MVAWSELAFTWDIHSHSNFLKENSPNMITSLIPDSREEKGTALECSNVSWYQFYIFLWCRSFHLILNLIWLKTWSSTKAERRKTWNDVSNICLAVTSCCTHLETLNKGSWKYFLFIYLFIYSFAFSFFLFV